MPMPGHGRSVAIKSDHRGPTNLKIPIMHMFRYFPKIPHIEPFPAAGAFHKMGGLGFGFAVGISAGFH